MLLAWSSPVSPEHDAEFTEWYTNTHMRQLVDAVPGVTATSRYRLMGSGTDGKSVRYLCCYELGGTDAKSAAAALGAARASGAFDMSSSIDVSVEPPVLQFVEPVD
jgi:hypothetical protein